MLDFLIGFIRGIAALSPIWFVLFIIFSNVGEKNPIVIQKDQTEIDKTYLQ
ncbi:hypothetical protein [Neobacillus cucumis]|uniref:hypothetical protein n=1 Tax=Neobacillus cucumis TaxID=1740721 RepID=UPI0015E0F8BF|nr:hypothetical protein [Neobacillus cucumis]